MPDDDLPGDFQRRLSGRRVRLAPRRGSSLTGPVEGIVTGFRQTTGSADYGVLKQDDGTEVLFSTNEVFAGQTEFDYLD